MSLRPTLKRIVEERQTLTREESRDLLVQMLREGTSESEIAAVLCSITARGEQPAEIAGFVDTVRALSNTIPLTDAERAQLVDTCGTGGDNSGTFNISTATALVAAAAGAKVAKHGNRSVTSKCGSADVLEALGIPVTLEGEAASAALRAHNFVYLHAPAMHPALHPIRPVRRALGVRTIMHLVFPLANPAGARRQIVGVSAAHLVPLVAEALALLGAQHAFVVHGAGGATGVDELSLAGPNTIAKVRDGAFAIRTITPEDLGLTRAPLSAIEGGNAERNAQILTAIFSGEPGPHRDVIVLNTAAVLVAADRAPDLLTAAALAAATIDSGAVTKLIAALQSSHA